VPLLSPGRDTRNKPTVSTVGPRARKLRSPTKDGRRLAVIRGGQRFCHPRRDQSAGGERLPTAEAVGYSQSSLPGRRAAGPLTIIEQLQSASRTRGGPWGVRSPLDQTIIKLRDCQGACPDESLSIVARNPCDELLEK